MSVREIPNAVWRRSSLCSGGDCVEVAMTDNTSTESGEGGDAVFLMRNSKDPTGRILRFTPEEWAGFIACIKKGALVTAIAVYSGPGAVRAVMQALSWFPPSFR
jgi:hypothetical protein